MEIQLKTQTQSDSQRNGQTQTHTETNATEHQMGSLHHVNVTTQKQETNKAAHGQMASGEPGVYDYSNMYIDDNDDNIVCPNIYSMWRTMALIIMMVCFIAATPLSLICTLPAYVFADRADIASQQGYQKPSHRLCLLSLLLNLLALASAIFCSSLAMFAYIYSHR